MDGNTLHNLSVSSRVVRAAVLQAEPAWFNLKGAIEKTCALMAEAASNGAHIIAFPELWIPGYPNWVWARPSDAEMESRYRSNALVVDSVEMRQIQTCAADHNIVVCLGFAERAGDSMFIAQCTIGNQGERLMTRRKLVLGGPERQIFCEGDRDSLENVVSTAAGRIGQLSCAENYSSLIRFSTYSQNEDIHCGGWPALVPFPGGKARFAMSTEAAESLSRVYSMQARCYTLLASAITTEDAVVLMGTGSSYLFNSRSGGTARVYGPDGRQVSECLSPQQEGIVYADLDLDLVAKYNDPRSDLLQLIRLR